VTVYRPMKSLETHQINNIYIMRQNLFRNCYRIIPKTSGVLQPYIQIYRWCPIDQQSWFSQSCALGISKWNRNKGHHRVWQNGIISEYFIEYWLQWQTDNYTICDDFDFAIVNFPFLCSNIPLSPVYGVYIPQLIRYPRRCFAYENFSKQGKLLTKKLMLQGYNESCLKSSFRKFYGRYN
jgi:hypothetical protein